MKKKKRWMQVVLPLLILISGFAGMQILIKSKPQPQKTQPTNPGLLVETLRVSATTHTIRVHATGTVQSRLSAPLVPQVSGRVLHVAKGFETGGFFQQGDLLFEIDPADYRLAAEKSRAEVVRAEYELAQVQSQARVARLEWERLSLDIPEGPNPLVLYEPQLKNAQAVLAAAKADLAQRRLDIDRTRVNAPFNGRVRTKNVDMGQYITAGQSVAEISGTDTAEIVVPVPLDDLPWLTIPKSDDMQGSKAQVQIDLGDKSLTWMGRIDRSLGEVDPKSRMMRIVVAVQDPYALANRLDSHLPLELAEGLFVKVTIEGRALKGVFALPASAIKQNATVWVMDKQNRLNIRPVRVLRREKNSVLVQHGLVADEKVVLTQLTGAVEGIQLRSAKEVPL